MELQAKDRLVITKIEAATDLKGAIKFASFAFREAGFKIKLTYSSDKDNNFDLKITQGKVTFVVEFDLSKKGAVLMHVLVLRKGRFPFEDSLQAMKRIGDAVARLSVAAGTEKQEVQCTFGGSFSE